jgi:hypothetical protein
VVVVVAGGGVVAGVARLFNVSSLRSWVVESVVLGLVLLGEAVVDGLVASQPLVADLEALGEVELELVSGNVLGVRAVLEVELVVLGMVLLLEVLAVLFKSQF